VVALQNDGKGLSESRRNRGSSFLPIQIQEQLEDFLMKEKTADPLRFPDLSLSIIKLMGAGEYMQILQETPLPPGHFAVSLSGTYHPQLLTAIPGSHYPQRLLKACDMAINIPVPYEKEILEALGKHCHRGRDTANKVERQV